VVRAGEEIEERLAQRWSTRRARLHARCLSVSSDHPSASCEPKSPEGW
jgi:hypothetical protein